MATLEFELLCAFEDHSVTEIRKTLDAGFDVRTPIKGKSAIVRGDGRRSCRRSPARSADVGLGSLFVGPFVTLR
jgi:hypothetical protein